jgi:hypothetical protein
MNSAGAKPHLAVRLKARPHALVHATIWERSSALARTEPTGLRRSTGRTRTSERYWRARYIRILAALSSTASPETSTRAFLTVPVNENGGA